MEIYNGKYCVYIHTNKINGKKYVGQTCQKPEYRWNNGKNYKECLHFYNAIEKYGWDEFDHEIIASNLTKDEADNFEKILIQKLDTMNPDIGYNLRAGGSEVIFSEESKKKMSESHIGLFVGEKHPMYGKKHSEESKNKISESSLSTWADSDFNEKMSEIRKQLWKNDEYRQRQIKIRTGKRASEETKQKRSNSLKGERNPMYGKHPSEETRQKMSEAQKRAQRQRVRKINQYTIDENFIRTWDCMKQIEDETGIKYQDISKCCRHKRKQAGGFMWHYTDESNDQIT